MQVKETLIYECDFCIKKWIKILKSLFSAEKRLCSEIWVAEEVREIWYDSPHH